MKIYNEYVLIILEQERVCNSPTISTYRPEFLNRVDDIIVFSKLGKEQIAKISEKKLSNLSDRFKNLNITAEFDDSVKYALAEKGFDPVYGARPLRREIQNKIEDPLAKCEKDEKYYNDIFDYTHCFRRKIYAKQNTATN